jgi:hypothetical protein
MDSSNSTNPKDADPPLLPCCCLSVAHNCERQSFGRQEMTMFLCLSRRYTRKMHLWFELPVGGRLQDAKYCCRPIYEFVGVSRMKILGSV